MNVDREVASQPLSVTYPNPLSRHESAFWQPSGELTRFRSLTFVPGQGRQQVVFEAQPFPMRNYWVSCKASTSPSTRKPARCRRSRSIPAAPGAVQLHPHRRRLYLDPFVQPELVLRDAANNPQTEIGSLELLVVEPDQPVLGWD